MASHEGQEEAGERGKPSMGTPKSSASADPFCFQMSASIGRSKCSGSPSSASRSAADGEGASMPDQSGRDAPAGGTHGPQLPAQLSGSGLSNYNMRAVRSKSAGMLEEEDGAPLHFASTGSTIIPSRADRLIEVLRVADLSRLQRKLAVFIFDTKTEMAVALLIMVNFVTICFQTDREAEGREASLEILIVLKSCMAVYVLEVMAHFFVERWRFFESAWNNFDLMVVAISLVGEIVSALQSNQQTHFTILRVVRLGRLLRLVRVLRLASNLRELKSLLEMMTSCFRALLWSILVVFLIMSVFATTLVMFVHPIVQDLVRRDPGLWEDCPLCPDAYSSVMMANLSIFQTVVASDSWGKVAIPVIREQPWTAILFISTLVVIVFGVLNMIVAVLVDVFAEKRNKDFVARSAEMEVEEIHEKRQLARIFQMIDVEKTGMISYELLLQGAREVPEFRHYLRVMDICGEEDMLQLFEMVDLDGSGEIDKDEFINALYHINNMQPKTATTFVKHYAIGIFKRQEEILTHLDGLQQEVLRLGGQKGTQYEIGLISSASLKAFRGGKSSSFSDIGMGDGGGPAGRDPALPPAPEGVAPRPCGGEGVDRLGLGGGASQPLPMQRALSPGAPSSGCNGSVSGHGSVGGEHGSSCAELELDLGPPQLLTRGVSPGQCSVPSSGPGSRAVRSGYDIGDLNLGLPLARAVSSGLRSNCSRGAGERAPQSHVRALTVRQPNLRPQPGAVLQLEDSLRSVLTTRISEVIDGLAQEIAASVTLRNEGVIGGPLSGDPSRATSKCSAHDAADASPQVPRTPGASLGLGRGPGPPQGRSLPTRLNLASASGALTKTPGGRAAQDGASGSQLSVEL